MQEKNQEMLYTLRVIASSLTETVPNYSNFVDDIITKSRILNKSDQNLTMVNLFTMIVVVLFCLFLIISFFFLARR